MRAGKAIPTPKDSEYIVTLDDGTRSVVSREEVVQLAAEEFAEWYKTEGEKRFQQRHKDALKGWILTKGVLLEHGYDLFVQVTQSLEQKGYKTLPVSKESDFQAQVAGYKRDHTVTIKVTVRRDDLDALLAGTGNPLTDEQALAALRAMIESGARVELEGERYKLVLTADGKFGIEPY